MRTKSLAGGAAALIAVSLVALAVDSYVPAHTRFELLSAALGRNKDAVQYVYLPAGVAKDKISLDKTSLDKTISPLMRLQERETKQYVYMPAAVAKNTKKRTDMLNALVSQSLDDVPEGVMNRSDPTTWMEGLGYNKSCAISSLVAQANFIFPHWNGCGYIHHPTTKKKGVVSAPSGDMFCGPDEMKMWPCNVKFERIFKNDNPGNLGSCYAKIPGLSQTCKYYKGCGTRTSSGDWNKDVCSSDTGDYYKEPEVQRMCGICGMYRAELADSRESLDEFGEGGSDEGGCIADSGIVWRRSGSNATRTFVREVHIGDEIWTAKGYQRVYYIKPHKHAVPTVELWWEGGGEGGRVEASRHHLLPVLVSSRLARELPSSPVSCQAADSMLKSIADVKVGDVILVAHSQTPHQSANPTCMFARVQRREERKSRVRYLLVQGDSLFVQAEAHAGRGTLDGGRLGALVSVYSSPLAAWETLPFRTLDALVPGCLQWPAVSLALDVALESPLLVDAEDALRVIHKLFTSFASFTARATTHSSIKTTTARADATACSVSSAIFHSAL